MTHQHTQPNEKGNARSTIVKQTRPRQLVTLDIEPLHLSLPGKVVQVNQDVSQSQTAVSYTVICQIEARDIQLMAGMTVTVTPGLLTLSTGDAVSRVW